MPETAKVIDWHQIFTISLTENFNLNIQVGVLLMLIIAVTIILLLIKLFFYKEHVFSPEIELNISLGGIGSVKIKQNREVSQVAHKAWVEFVTRKAGLEFNPDHDVITEVYNSWYQLFERIRSLIKEIPADKIKNDNTQALVKILVNSLNNGLRPHLTRWQAQFRRWYESELQKKENADKTPQEIQRMYPFYDELVRDLILVNQQVISYTNEIKKIGK